MTILYGQARHQIDLVRDYVASRDAKRASVSKPATPSSPKSPDGIKSISPKEVAAPKPRLKRSARLKTAFVLRNHLLDAGIAVILIIAGGFAGWSLKQATIDQLPILTKIAPSLTQVAAPQPAPTASGSVAAAGKEYPRLMIPKLAINAPITTVGKTKTAEMDVPSSGWMVGWYSLGPKIGEPGNAVIDGHAGAPNQNAVFKNLSKLAMGDTFTVQQLDGSILTFKVTKTQAVAPRNAPLRDIFGPSSAAHLNLISCYGAWRKDDYAQRFIVYSDRVQ